MRTLGWILMGAASLAFGLQVAELVELPLAALAYFPVSLLTACVYWLDKRRAVRGGRRIPENTLHLLEAAGGWPGALWAQEQFRHKTVDRRFRLVFWAIGLLHLGGWAAWGAWRLT